MEDGEVDHGALFHTYLEAVGVDSTGSFVIDGRKMPMADPAAVRVYQIGQRDRPLGAKQPVETDRPEQLPAIVHDIELEESFR